MKLASSEEGSASYSEEASSQREDLRKKKLQGEHRVMLHDGPYPVTQ